MVTCCSFIKRWWFFWCLKLCLHPLFVTREKKCLNLVFRVDLFILFVSIWFCSLFKKQEMKISLAGLENVGKTSLVNVVANDGYSEDISPTVGFDSREVAKGNVTIKICDLSGQPRFRPLWELLCCDVSAIVYVVDAADLDNLSVSKSELHRLLSKTSSLNGIPLLVLGNKIDKTVALSKEALTDEMGLSSITGREVCCFMISCKNSTGIDQVIDWLVNRDVKRAKQLPYGSLHRRQFVFSLTAMGRPSKTMVYVVI